MALALFDLDNTLLNGDSDHAWGLYLAKIGVVDADQQQKMQDYFYQQYTDGCLNMQEFLDFQLLPLKLHSVEQLLSWRNGFIADVITPMLETSKQALLEPHRKNGDDILIITATNDFITRPIADLLGVSTLIATTAEMKDGVYTGKAQGTPCFQDGKIVKLDRWLSNNNKTLDDSYFYSDSTNDLPLLKKVDHPIVVTPDDRLRQHALDAGWKIIE